MADDKLDALLRTTDNATMSLEQSRKFNNTKRKINAICKALTLETQKYAPQKTVENIDAYISSPNKLDRILYSEISSFVFSLEMEERGVFATNLEKLLLYSLDDNNNVSEDSKRIIIKIYDHFQLALHQIENVNNTESVITNTFIKRTLSERRGLPGEFAQTLKKKIRSKK